MARRTGSDETLIHPSDPNHRSDTGSDQLLGFASGLRIYEKVFRSNQAAANHYQNLVRQSQGYSESILERYPRLKSCFGSRGRFGRCILLCYGALHLFVAFVANFANTSWILYTLIFFGCARALWSGLPILWNLALNALPEGHRSRFKAAVHLCASLIFLGLVIVKAFQDNALISLVGIVAGILLCYALSHDRSAIVWRPVIYGFVLQYVFAFFILQTSIGLNVFSSLGDGAQTLMNFSQVGGDFIFSKDMAPLAYIVVRVLPSIIFFSTVSSVLYHIGVIQVAVTMFGAVMEKTMQTSALESLVAAANIFLGQSEAPLLIAPYLGGATAAELHSIMTAGFSTIAGGVMGAYLAMGVPAAHLIGASVISAPAALAISKIVYPEKPRPALFAGGDQPGPPGPAAAPAGCLDDPEDVDPPGRPGAPGDEIPPPAAAAGRGADHDAWDEELGRVEHGGGGGGGGGSLAPRGGSGRAGRKEFCDGGDGEGGGGGAGAHAPGGGAGAHARPAESMSDDDAAAAAAVAAAAAGNNLFAAATAGASTGLQLAANVGAMLVAFVSLEALADSAFGWWWGLVGLEGWSLTGALGVVFWPFAFLIGVPPQDCLRVGRLIGLKTVLNEFVAYVELVRMKGDGELEDKSIILATYILCGFSNLTSIGVQLAGLGVLAPSRSRELSELVLSALFCGFMACYSTACIAGLLVA